MTETPRPKSASIELRIVNKRGMHARAAAKFCAVAGGYDAAVKVTKERTTVGGRSIMGLLTLGAGFGSVITIEADGPQAEEALESLTRLITSKFGENE